jgi:hypothetical protein
MTITTIRTILINTIKDTIENKFFGEKVKYILEIDSN